MSKSDATPEGSMSRHLADFDEQLDSILGKRRIPRRDKKVKAEAAMRAVDDLVEVVERELKGTRKN